MSECEKLAEAQSQILADPNTPESILVREIGIALAGMRHGEITITIRAGKVIEIERVTRDRPLNRKP